MHVIASEEVILCENLRTAFVAESITHVRYAEFADKADGEGWHGVASLFRATARAEHIHAGNHGRILHQLGGDTTVAPHAVEVRTTLENLRESLAEEVSEVDSLYPAFIEHARACRDVAAVRTFMWALEAEKTHARLLNEALALLEIDDEDSWVTMARDFFLCPVCGYTSAEEDEAEMCPVCRCSWSRFERIR